MTPRSGTRPPRGVTFVEVLISLVLVCMVMGIVAQLSQLFASLLNFSSQKDQAMQVELAMWHVCCECECATTWSSPADGTLTSAPQLTFTRVDPSMNPEPATPTARLPLPLPSPLPLSYSGFSTSVVVTVLYYLDGSTGNLIRQVTPPGTPQSVTPLLGFSCQNLADHRLQLNYVYTSGETVFVRSQQAYLPLR